MKLKNLLMKVLFVAFGLCVGQSVWAETIGATNKGWPDAGSYKKYPLSANKTLTLTFTVTDFNGDWGGYVFNLTKTNNPDIAGGVWFRSPDFAWHKTNWNTGAVVINTNTRGSMTQSDWQAFVKGATTVMNIQRFVTQVFIKTTVTKDETSYTHYFVQEIGTTSDVNAFLCADAAVIDIASDATTETSLASIEATTATIGAVDNNNAFAASPVTTLAPESVLNMHFTNSSSKGDTFHNYGIELMYGGKYANIVVGGGRWGELLVDDAKSDPVTTPVTNKEEHFNEFGSGFKNKMDGADVSLTIIRSGRVVTIIAVHTPADNGTPYTLKYTIEPNAAAFPNFATEDIDVNLSTDHSHIIYNFPISQVNTKVFEYGWATYCSPYALDLQHATGLTDAYIVTGGENGVLTKTSVKNGTVPANTGLLLKADEGAVSMPIVGTSTTNVSANKLIGKTAAYNLPANDGYVLMATGSNGLGFYKNANIFTVGANTAYLPADFAGGAPAREFFSLDDDATAISEAKSQQPMANGLFFDLQGRKVAQPQKGLYIVNGKKVVMK